MTLKKLAKILMALRELAKKKEAIWLAVSQEIEMGGRIAQGREVIFSSNNTFS